MINWIQLDNILEGIRRKLEGKQDNELYARFKSFFFVLQVIGVKVSTSVEDDWCALWDKLVDQFQDFDWDYMENTENGELLVDIGFDFHPPEGSNLVGFWDMDAVHQGFQYGGYASPVSHSVSTASAIGGMHAEMMVA